VKSKFAGSLISFVIAFKLMNPPAEAAGLAEPQVKKITVAYTSFAPAQMWMWLEKDLGYFREEGLQPEFVLVRNATVAVKGLLAENFDYMASGGAVVEAVVRARQPLKVILTVDVSHFWLMGQPQIRTIADLKGKSVAVNAVGSPTDFTMQEILKRHGLTAYRDVSFVAIGNSSQRFAALASGTVQSALVSPPFNLKAAQMGYRKLADATDYVKWPQSGLATRDDKITRDRDEAFKMVRAALKGLKFVMTQRDYTVSKLIHIFKLTREEASETYKSLREEAIPGSIGDEAERQVISVARQAGNIAEEVPTNRVFDTRFVTQAQRELKDWAPRPPR
jgi:ABC-type nitrate/sulfonate/bicarbonate transport system substrate-binding protein